MPQVVSRSSICEMLARFSEGLDTAEAEHCRSQLIINHPGSGRPAPASAPGMPRIQEEAEEYIEASVCGGSSAASSSRNTASTRGSSRMSGYNSFYQGSHKMLQTNDNIAFSKTNQIQTIFYTDYGASSSSSSAGGSSSRHRAAASSGDRGEGMISVKITRDAEQRSGDTATAADNKSFNQEEPDTSSYEAWVLMEDFITLIEWLFIQSRIQD